MQAMAEGRRGRWTTTRGEHRRGYEQQRKGTLAILSACLFVYLFVSHMLVMAEGQRRGRRYQRTTCTSPKKVRWLYYLSVVYFCFKSLCCLPHAGYGGGTTTKKMVVTTIKGTRGQHHRRTYVGYTTCLLLFSFGCYLFGLLWQRDNHGGWWWRQRDERTTLPKKVRWLYYLSVVYFCYLFVVSHMLANGGGTTTRRMVT